jgi:hypothetical protein
LIYIFTAYYSFLILFENSFLKANFFVKPTDILLILSLVYLLKNKQLIEFDNLLKILVSFVIVTIIFVIISIIGLNSTLTEFYDKSFILRQAYFPFYMVIFILCLRALFVNENSTKLKVFIYTISFVAILKFLNDYVVQVINFEYTSGGAFVFILFSIPAFFLSIKNKYIYLVMYILWFQKSSQGADWLSLFLLIYIFIIVLKAKFNDLRIQSIFILFAMLLLGYFAYENIDELRFIDSNSWWRLLIWENSINLSLDNLGLGVGFGTEYYSLNLQYIIHSELASDNIIKTWIENSEFMLQAPHNSFVTVFLRLGWIGLLIIGLLFYELFKIIDRLENLKIKIFLFYLLCYSFIFIFFNMSFESPRYLMGNILFFSFISAHTSKNFILNFYGKDTHN